MSDYARGGIIPGPGATPKRHITFERHVSPEQRHRFLREFARQICTHLDAVPVESAVDRTVLAWLCPACDAQLPADHPASQRCEHENTLGVYEFPHGTGRLIGWRCTDCGETTDA